jgi:hypothetical protein
MKKRVEPLREKFALYIDKEVLERLRAHQDDVGAPIAVSIRKALDAYVLTLPKTKR